MEIKRYYVYHMLAKVYTIITDQISRAEGVAHGYNHWFCKPSFPDKYFIRTIKCIEL